MAIFSDYNVGMSEKRLFLKNVGLVDRVFRLLVGIIILSALFWVEGNFKFLGLIGLIPFATALMGTCPLYSLIGLSTCKAKRV